jgi:5-hydroxyisourate hydrolase-like protein (transthyretin family)
MKRKFILFFLIGLAGCIQSNASDEMIGGPGIRINELSGSIVDAESGKPLKEVTVTAFIDSKKEKLVITDENGRFDIDELKSGNYKLVFEKAGYKKLTREKVPIKEDETSRLRIEMDEQNGFEMIPSPFYFMDHE